MSEKKKGQQSPQPVKENWPKMYNRLWDNLLYYKSICTAEKEVAATVDSSAEVVNGQKKTSDRRIV